MRIVGVVILWGLIIGGITMYMVRQGRDVLPSPGPVEYRVEEKESFFVEITLTCRTEKDPYILDGPGHASDSGLILKMGDSLLPVSAEGILPGVPFKAGPFTGRAVAVNELFVQASPPVDQTDIHNTLRLRVFDKDRVVAEKTLWGDPGQNMAGTLQFILTPQLNKDNHEY